MSNYLNTNFDQIALMFKALSNPQRLRIFLKLTKVCSPIGCCDANPEGIRRCVGDLGEDLGLADSTISHHIKELRQAGLLNVQRCGQKVECWISDDALKLLNAFVCDTVCKTNLTETGVESGSGKK